MSKSDLQKIFSQSFNLTLWQETLREIFGVKRLLSQPRTILLPNNDKAESAYELGSFSTSDGRVVGLYQVKVLPGVWLEKNKVGLRSLLRNVYRYDVDGALIVFVQKDKWRLSFVSEIKVLNDEGEIIEEATEPKRYTYLLGSDEKVRTPAERLAGLAGKTLTLKDLSNAFSVEALNEEFYKIVQRYFYQLVGGTVGNAQKQSDFGNGILQLPSQPKTNRQLYQEFSVRLIGRTIFCWFLKMKKPKEGEALLPESLLSSQAVRDNKNYYHTILEKIFFQTLNTPMDQRVATLPPGAEAIPFLNGGLFEDGPHDFYRPSAMTGLSEHINTLKIDDKWFLGLFEDFEKYNFTIDENSVIDVEVSVDPEMLGRIFENLLAEIDPDSGETARKATGSFYTPREIVDYMSTESLVQYLHNKTDIDKEAIRPLFRMTELELPEFTIEEREKTLNALDKVRVLDPACGSGAFPMGVLQKIVQALQKLDEHAEWWIERQVNHNTHPSARQAVREKLTGNPEYARKIGIIQNSLYGVDIQPIAAEISKLRCFLTLVVDEHIRDDQPNRGIEPLPNLEFKFVTANTLIKLPEQENQTDAFDNYLELQELEKLRIEYLQSYGDQKEQIKKDFIEVQLKIFKAQMALFNNKNQRAFQLSTWNPFNHSKTGWFDPKWMFGIQKFDMVIGNPPYLRLQGIQKSYPELVTYAKKHYKRVTTGNWDLYVLFDVRGFSFLESKGVLCYIQPHKFLQADFGVGLRRVISEDQSLAKIVHFGAEQVFNSATNYTCLLFLEANRRSNFDFLDASSPQAWKTAFHNRSALTLDHPQSEEKWHFMDAQTQGILDQIKRQPESLGDVTRKIFVGLQTSADKIYILKVLEKKSITYRVYSQSRATEFEIEKGLVKPFLMGKDVKRYQEPQPQNVVIFPYLLHAGKASLMTVSYLKKHFPLGWEYIQTNKKALEQREKGKMKHEQFYAYIYPKNLVEFDSVKVMTPEIAERPQLTIDKEGLLYHTTKVYSFVFKEGLDEDKYYWLGLLNSKLLWFFLSRTGYVLRGNFYVFKTNYLTPFSVKRIDFETPHEKSAHDVIVSLVKNILYLNTQIQPINPHVPNTHMAERFEELIDAIVMELYFPWEFQNAGIEFIKYAKRDLLSFEGKSETEKREIIHAAYQKLREKDNEIRNNLKLMDIKLADIILPIKNA